MLTRMPASPVEAWMFDCSLVAKAALAYFGSFFAAARQTSKAACSSLPLAQPARLARGQPRRAQSETLNGAHVHGTDSKQNERPA